MDHSNKAEWVTLQDAARLVSAKVSSTSLGQELLEENLKGGKIRARAAHLRVKSGEDTPRTMENESLTPEFWAHAHIIWQLSEAITNEPIKTSECELDE